MKIFRENLFLRNQPCAHISTLCIVLYLLTHFVLSVSLFFPLQMEEEFNVFVCPDGDYFHTPRKLTGKYASEGYFFKNIRESRFFTDDPSRAHLFFLPISCHKMRGKGLTEGCMIVEVDKYVEHLKFKYPYWNRTLGADHCFVTCHDIGVKATKRVPYLAKNSIQVVCSSTYDNDAYIAHKDVTLPQIQLPLIHPAGRNDIKNRNTLAFWAGRSDSRLKDELAFMWDNDTELDIQNNRVDLRATGQMVYMDKLYKSKFCLCPHGPIGSSCVIDSIHYGCVPVIMSNYYDLPFNDVLDWRKFSVILKETDVYLLKDILKSIYERHFMALNRNLVKVQKHFKWSTLPVRLDVFHMVMFKLWLHRYLIRNTITFWGRLDYEPAFMWDQDTRRPISRDRIADSISSINFDFWKLAMTWPGGFCKHENCRSSIPNKFTIHGLLPSNYPGPHPYECTQEAFTYQMIQSVYRRLVSDWPSLTMRTHESFWKSEWRKHGTCSTLDGADYFELALNISSCADLTAILVKAGITPGASYDYYDIVSAIEAAIGFVPEIKCVNDDLVEIGLCLDTTPTYIHCSGWTNCPFHIYF